MKIPQQSDMKEIPNESKKILKVPDPISLSSAQIEETPKLKLSPKESNLLESIPEASPKKEEKPSDVIEENCVKIGDRKIEIKPTKLKYFRNKAASAYGIIKAVPLHEFLTYDVGVLDKTRSADQLLYDFLVAAFDNSSFVRDVYDELDADIVEQIVKIFGRINHIDEKEEQARKNREAQAEAKH